MVPAATGGPWGRTPGLLVGGAAAAAVLAVGGYLAAVALQDGGRQAELTSADSALPGGGQGLLGVPGDGDQNGKGDRGGRRGRGGGVPLDPTRATQGIVSSVAGDTLALRGVDGSSVTVIITGDTTVRRLSAQGMTEIPADGLQAGDLVVVEGSRQNDGSYRADRIIAAPGYGSFGLPGRGGSDSDDLPGNGSRNGPGGGSGGDVTI
jgi:hypothetical protein